MTDVKDASVTGAENIHWTLSDLYTGPDDPQIPDDMTQADSLAEEFAAEFRGQVASLDAAGLRGALEAYQVILDMAGKATSYAEMLWSTDTAEPTYGSLKSRITEWRAELEQQLIFFELEWINIPDDHAQALLDDPALAAFRHWLEIKRLHKSHALSEAEERLISAKAVTGRSAWVRYMDEVQARARYELDGETLNTAQIRAKYFSPDRDLRRRAFESMTAGFKEKEHALTFIYNTVCADKAADDKLRGYPSWISSRNQANEVSDEAVDALIEAVQSRYDIAQRVYELKRRILGYDEIFTYDLYAPISDAAQQYTWEQARAIVLDAFGRFNADFAATAELFFSRDWIDAAPAPNKPDGAYCEPVVPSAHPYVFMNFTGTARNVATLAHELGHGIHFYLAREQGALHFMMPLTIAETGSVFGESLVMETLIADAADPQARLALLMRKLERSLGTVFTQVMFNRFEHAMHTARREQGELSGEQLADMYFEIYSQLAGDVITVLPENRYGWAIPHFMWEPGYVYAYAFGELLTQALLARYRVMGETFIAPFLNLLRAGGSMWPQEALDPLGVDLADPDFWHGGLREIEALVVQAEEAFAVL